MALAGLDRRERLAFYEHGYSWALTNGEWAQEDVEILQRRFQELLPGLDRLLAEDQDEEKRWGGPAVAELANRFLSDAAPILKSILEGVASGRIQQEKVYLLWSYTHMFTNRLGIESGAEAVLRFFMHRHLQAREPAEA